MISVAKTASGARTHILLFVIYREVKARLDVCMVMVIVLSSTDGYKMLHIKHRCNHLEIDRTTPLD